MSDDANQIPSGFASDPASSADGPMQEMLAKGVLAPPRSPGIGGHIGDFDILRFVGQGGMGMVFQGRNTRTVEEVALKFLRPDHENRPKVLQRFLLEAGHLKTLRHPHIVPVLDVFDRAKGPYFVMPFYARGTLASGLRKGGPVEAGAALQIALQLAEALEFIHSKGLTHRDVKPGNILIESNGHIRLSDFGLAQSIYNDPLVDPSKITPQGSAPYMSPQIASGQSEDTRCDVYAFGAVLYEMLTGKAPYKGETKEVIEQIKAGPPVPITKHNRDAHAGLVAVAEGAMGREHRNRYANMSDVLADLRRIETGGFPLGPSGRAGWYAHARRRLPAIAAGCLLCGLIVFGAWWAMAEPTLEVSRVVDLPEAAIQGRVVSGHWDGDGAADLIYSENDRLRVLLATGESRTVPFAPAQSLGMYPTLAQDVDADGLDEAFISWRDGTNSHIEAINQYGWPLLRCSIPEAHGFHKEYGVNWSHLQAFRFQDLNGDKASEVLAEIGMGWGPTNSALPWLRGLACFEGKSGNQKWFFETAPFPWRVETADIDGDGRLEILAGSHSVGNGKKLKDGTDDAHTYLFALSCEGKLLWRRDLGGVFSTVSPMGVSFSPDAGAEIFVYSETDAQLGDKGEVLKFNAKGDLLSQYDVGTSIRSGKLIEFAPGGKRYVAVTDCRGNLHLLDRQLALKRKLNVTANKHTWIYLDIVGTAHGQTKPLLVLASTQVENRREAGVVVGNTKKEVQNFVFHRYEILLVDLDLEIVDRHLLSPISTRRDFSATVLPSKRGQPPEILALLDKAVFLRIKEPLSLLK